ncbi:oxidoreductase [Catellatospora methionotrophica]|uniref:Oxidoreductase n=1 Tax=Catellatospora methionotrophica TaxID=121620 RepID=A0A8J3PES7_9ACTN|nr:FAD-binding oxidoreductase [Catellatospora methionotrophica]GIG13638.1 oxidoreductase [Catellatospora methionotrophica]
MTVIGDTAVADLRAGFAGSVLGPSDAAYADARALFNSMITKRPSVIAQCATGADVSRAIEFGREQGLEIAVRGGGHGVAGTASTDGGVVIDLRRMNQATVDPRRRTVRIGGGATMSHLDRATQPFDLATTGGRVSTTGVGGFTLGGGSGWLERKFGLACDNLLAAELITADGNTVVASEESHPDLFWALHGGGGNFGVVTSLTLRLHPLPTASVALLLWPPEAGPEVTRAYRDFMENAPPEVGGGVIYLTGPAEPFTPAHLVGRLTCAMLITYAGDLARARSVVGRLLKLGHQGELIAEVPYAELQAMFDDPPGYRNYWSAEHLDTLPDRAVDLFCARAYDMVVPSPSQHVLFPYGGAVADGPTGFPVPWRRAPWVVHPLGLWTDDADDERAVRWARDLRADVKPWSTGAVYSNFIGQEGQERVVAGYGLDNYRRLSRVKAAYDPDNTFHLNPNIRPER